MQKQVGPNVDKDKREIVTWYPGSSQLSWFLKYLTYSCMAYLNLFFRSPNLHFENCNWLPFKLIIDFSFLGICKLYQLTKEVNKSGKLFTKRPSNSNIWSCKICEWLSAPFMCVWKKARITICSCLLNSHSTGTNHVHINNQNSY